MKKLCFCLFIFLNYPLFSQIELKYDVGNKNLPKWVNLMYSKEPKIAETVKEYNLYYKKNKLQKNKHTQYYKRWLRNISRYSNAPVSSKISNSSNQWQCVGPWDFDQFAESRSYAPGACHIYTVEQSISNPNILYAGTATAGAWKSYDKGNNWELITSEISLNSVYAIEIDFTNPDIIYISGNGKLYKSTNSGSSWSIIGNTSFTNLSHSIKDIKLNPDNNQILYVASNQGLFKSIDGGNNFSNISSGKFQEIEFHPFSTDTMYFIENSGDSTIFYRSIDGGNNIVSFSNGWPSPNTGEEQKRTEIAVSPADSNKVVALATGSANGGSGLYGIYISYNCGESWTFQCCGAQPAGPASINNINLMGWQPDGSDDGGQYYYDLALALNPNNADIIHVGGVNHWISIDNGLTFSCPAKWSEPHKKGYVHADIHDINYFDNDLWFASDGGIFYSNNSGDSIYKKMKGISGTDFWGFGVGFKDKNIMLGGTYHNGTLLKDGSTYINDWLSTDGGDNVRGFVNFGNPRIAYSDYGGKILSGNRNQPITNFNIDKLPNASYIVGESSNIAFDPRCPNWFFTGKDSILWYTNNNGGNFIPIYHFNDKITSIEVAWSDPNVIYLSTWPSWWGTKKIWRSGDRGNTWSDITPTNINGQDWIPYDITVSSQDENIIWIARCSMYGGVQDAQGYEVFKSVDGGQNWINITTSTLDNINATNIVHQRGSNGGVYLGTRNTVYYKNNNMQDWEIYNNNLPKSTFSTQLVPNYREGLLLNGTNRSAYEINFYEDSPPSAQIAANKLNINCLNDTVQFIDHSALRKNSASWQWSFIGGNPSSSNLEDPIVVYSSPGNYDVSLTVTDIFGTSTQYYSNFIKYSDTIFSISNNNSLHEGFDSGNFPPNLWSTPNATFSWTSINVDSGYNCLPTTTAFVNHYSINQRGKEAYLLTKKISLNGSIGAQNWLIYDYAYSGYSSSYNDGLRIDVSLDCGNTWDSIYGAIGQDLQTTNYVTGPWNPTCGSWLRDSIDLSSLGLNGDTMIFRFAAINDYGNKFYLDNININGQSLLNIDDQVNSNTVIFPNPNNGNFKIRTDLNNYEVKISTSLGKSIYNKATNEGTQKIDLSKYPKGIYILEVNSSGYKEQKKLIIQ